MTKKKSEDVVKELAAEEAESLSPLGKAVIEVTGSHSTTSAVTAASQDAVVDHCIAQLKKTAAMLGGVGHFETNSATKLLETAIKLLEQCQETTEP